MGTRKLGSGPDGQALGPAGAEVTEKVADAKGAKILTDSAELWEKPVGIWAAGVFVCTSLSHGGLGFI